MKEVNGVIDAELDGPAAAITVIFEPSKRTVKAIAEAAKASLDSDHAHMMRGGRMAEIEYR
jgi:copper chaperone CopZ